MTPLQHTEKLKADSDRGLAVLHRQLGEQAFPDGFYYREGKRVDVDTESPLRGLHVEGIARPPFITDDYISEARASMGEERWQELNAADVRADGDE